MSCVDLKYISNEECIGNSLSSINGNFAALSAAVCDFNVVDSSTIDLDWNASTRTLSADVKLDSIRYSNLASWQTLSASTTLSAEAVQPRLMKAYISFVADYNNTVPNYTDGQIFTSFNIKAFEVHGNARYTIYFKDDTFTDKNYTYCTANAGHVNQATTVGIEYAPQNITGTPVNHTLSACRILVNNSQDIVSCGYISVGFFGK